MRKQIILGASVLIGALTFSGTAGAVSIDETGQGSNNQITFNVNDQCYITTTNTIFLTNTNQQISSTGQVTITGNTGSANATSGSAGNINNATFQGVITNAGTCAAAPVTSTPTPQPEQPKVESAATTTTTPQVKTPVGGVAAGSGGTDRTGALIALLTGGVVALVAGLSKLRFQRES